jgi:serine protease Do
MRSARLSPTLAIMLAVASVLPAAAQGTGTDPAAEMPPPISEPDDLEGAVVFIRASGQFADPSGTSQGESSGSGFIISPDGNIVTANHVVAGANVVWVEIPGRETPVNAIVMGRSECDDLALLDVPLDGLPYLAWSDTPPVAGLPVVAVGFPDGDRRFFRARGQINREPGPGVTNWASIEEEIEHDATTAPGASGGPLVDGSTRVTGVHYAGLNNRSYAIAAHEAISVLERFTETSSPGSILTIGLNGEAFAATDTTPAGVFVRSVERGSPAALAGVEAGDLITTLNGVPLAEDGTMASYCAVLRSTRPGSVLDLEVVRPDGTLLTGQVNGTALVESGSVDPFGTTDPIESGAPVGPGDARVLASVPEDIRPTCQESPPEDWPNEAIASVKCFPESGVDVIWYDLFGTGDDMDEYYFAVVTENDLTRSSGGPCNRRPGEVPFEVGGDPGGRLACYRRDGSVWFVWKTNELLTVSTAVRTGENQRPIYDFWTTAGPLF